MKPTPAFANNGLEWSDAENDLLVRDYFEMLDEHLSGRPYSKADRRQALRSAGVHRSDNSFHRKQQNISAALLEIGIDPLPGYSQSVNFQKSLLDSIEHYLAEGHIDRYDEIIREPSFPKTPFDIDRIFVDPPEGIDTEPRSLAIENLVRRFDPVARDYRNRKLGKEGEAFVLEVESQRLINFGRPDLIPDLRWVAKLDGDGAGYDIRSFNEQGDERFIEVKTTKGLAATPFFLTPNEIEVARSRQAWTLYRVHQFGPDAKIFEIKPPLDDKLTMTAALWKATPA